MAEAKKTAPTKPHPRIARRRPRQSGGRSDRRRRRPGHRQRERPRPRWRDRPAGSDLQGHRLAEAEGVPDRIEGDSFGCQEGPHHGSHRDRRRGEDGEQCEDRRGRHHQGRQGRGQGNDDEREARCTFDVDHRQARQQARRATRLPNRHARRRRRPSDRPRRPSLPPRPDEAQPTSRPCRQGPAFAVSLALRARRFPSCIAATRATGISCPSATRSAGSVCGLGSASAHGSRSPSRAGTVRIV